MNYTTGVYCGGRFCVDEAYGRHGSRLARWLYELGAKGTIGACSPEIQPKQGGRLKLSAGKAP